MMKRSLIVLLCLTLFIGFAPHGWSKTPKDTLVVAMRSAPPTLDPHIQDTIPTWSQLATVYERLVTFDAKGKMQNELMTDWELVDPLTWKIYLRKGVKFHNGEPFTSNAVKVTIEKYVDPTLKTPQNNPWKKNLDRVEIVDDHTLLIRTKTQVRPMLNWFVALNIISPKANEELGNKLGVTAVGTGPYKFAEYIPNDRFVLEANPEYWGEKPKLKRIVFRVIPEDSSRLAALEAGEIDMMTEVSPDHVGRIQSDPNLKLISTDTVRVLYIRLRENRKPLDDVRVRRALNYAVNKKEIVKYLLRGMGAAPTAPLHPLLMGYNPNLTSYEYNPAKAKELLAEAGYPNGFKLTYSSTHGRYIKDKQIAEAIVGQLKKVGITCEYTPLEIGTMVSQDLFGETHDMYSLAFGGILWDPDLPLSFFHNVLKYNNPEYVKFIEIGRTNQDKKVYEKAYQDALAVMWNDAPMLWVSYHPQIIAIQKGVKGFKPRADELVIVNNVWKTE